MNPTIRQRMQITIGLAGLALASAAPGTAIGAPPTARHETLAHEIMRMESSIPGVRLDFRPLDDLIDQAVRRIPRRASYTRQQVVAVLQEVDRLLLDNGFVYRKDTGLLCRTFAPARLTPAQIATLRSAAKTRALRHPNGVFHLSDCGTNTYLYVAICEKLNLPLCLALGPGHV